MGSVRPHKRRKNGGGEDALAGVVPFHNNIVPRPPVNTPSPVLYQGIDPQAHIQVHADFGYGLSSHGTEQSLPPAATASSGPAAATSAATHFITDSSYSRHVAANGRLSPSGRSSPGSRGVHQAEGAGARPVWPPTHKQYQSAYLSDCIRQARSLGELCNLYDTHSAELTASGLALLLWRIAKLRSGPKAARKRGGSPSGGAQADGSAGESQEAWRYSSAPGHQPATATTTTAAGGAALCGTVLDALTPQLQHCSTIEVAQVLWATAKLSLPVPPAALQGACSRLLDPTDGVLQSGSPWLISNVAWALAQQQLGPEGGSGARSRSGSGTNSNSSADQPAPLAKLWRALLQSAQAQAHDFNGQDCSNLLWACATVRAYDGEVCSAIAHRAAQQARALSNQVGTLACCT